MRFSRPLKSSTHSLPSPNGAYIATILPSKLTFRLTRSLEISRVITLPADFASSIQWFLWSLSSRRVLLSTSDFIRVFSIVDTKFVGTISNPTSGTTKIASLAFGATDDEICVFSDFGLKLAIFNLITSTSVDISCPKLFNSTNSSKGYTYRPKTLNLALLSRSNGKDIISIHARTSYEVLRSWHPDTIDAQLLSWSPDGKWLAVIESAGHGHRTLFYTANGNLYKSWNGPMPTSVEEQDIAVGAGVKLIAWNSTGDYIAVGDYTSKIILLSAPSFIETVSLKHSMTIRPSNALQIWQEHVIPSQSRGFSRTFILSTQTTCPPTTGLSQSTGDANAKIGTSMVAFDASGTLVATRSECMPTTVWIWDIATKVLKTVIILHAPVAKATWHPAINEILMIKCEGEESKGLLQLWEPSWETPKILDFGSQLPDGKIIGKSVVRWLSVDSTTPAVFFSDTQDCMLASLLESEDEELPWQEAVARGLDIYGEREESPLNLLPANEKRSYRQDANEAPIKYEPTMTSMSEYSDEVDDTFQFKKFVEP